MTKLLSMHEAVARFVSDGSSVLLGAALEALIPFAVGHEIIRQRCRDLTLVGPISDMLFDRSSGRVAPPASRQPGSGTSALDSGTTIGAPSK